MSYNSSSFFYVVFFVRECIVFPVHVFQWCEKSLNKADSYGHFPNNPKLFPIFATQRNIQLQNGQEKIHCNRRCSASRTVPYHWRFIRSHVQPKEGKRPAAGTGRDEQTRDGERVRAVRHAI